MSGARRLIFARLALLLATTSSHFACSFLHPTTRIARPSRLAGQRRLKELSTISINGDVDGFSDNSPADTTSSSIWNRNYDLIETDFVVCGGGPAGLLSAIMLAQKFPQGKIKLYDRLSPPPRPSEEIWNDVARFYLIGLGSRGQSALQKFGILKEVQDCSVMVIGRKDWAPGSDEGVVRLFEDRKVQTLVLPRDKLAGVLYQHILDNYSNRIELNYRCEVRPLDFGMEKGGRVIVGVTKCSPAVSNIAASEEKTASEQQEEVLCDTDYSTVVLSKLLIAADGTVRTISRAIQRKDEIKFASMNPIQRLLFAGSPFQIRKFKDDNRRIYKTIPMKLPSSWRADLNYSARSRGSRIVFDALPANKKGDYCGVILLRETDSLAKANSSPIELRSVLDEALPEISAIIDDKSLATVAKKPPSYLPAFRYIGPRLNEGDKTLVLGDCAHTLKPYFGLGANSALEDVKVLGDIIDSTDSLGEAVHLFSKTRAIEAKKLVSISRNLDRPGLLGFVTFVLPIILDAIFHKLLPAFFAPNVITMLQRDDLTFRQVARKKRMDRLGQILLLAAGGYGVSTALGVTFSLIVGGGYGVFAALKFQLLSLSKALGLLLAKVLGRRTLPEVAARLGGALVGLFLLRKLLPLFIPGLVVSRVKQLEKEMENNSQKLDQIMQLLQESKMQR